jgi:hypothetical protein
MNGSRNRKALRRFRGTHPAGAVYNNYTDWYYDYTDYGNYPDTYHDTTTYPDYQDYGDYNDSGARRPDYGPGRWKMVQKILILEGENSYLLAGDPDIGSSLFEKLDKDSKGRPIGVLPALLNHGWVIRRILPVDAKGRFTVVVQSFVAG